VLSRMREPELLDCYETLECGTSALLALEEASMVIRAVCGDTFTPPSSSARRGGEKPEPRKKRSASSTWSERDESSNGTKRARSGASSGAQPTALLSGGGPSGAPGGAAPRVEVIDVDEVSDAEMSVAPSPADRRRLIEEQDAEYELALAADQAADRAAADASQAAPGGRKEEGVIRPSYAELSTGYVVRVRDAAKEAESICTLTLRAKADRYTTPEGHRLVDRIIGLVARVREEVAGMDEIGFSKLDPRVCLQRAVSAYFRVSGHMRDMRSGIQEAMRQNRQVLANQRLAYFQGLCGSS
jgi:hypothetical protein